MVRVRFETLIVASLTIAAVLLFTGVLPVFASVVWGTSMLPTLKPLDIVVAVKPWLKKVRVGEIAIVEVDGVRLVHRVIEVKDGVVVTKGDNNPFPDPPAKKVLGVVVLVIPREIVVFLLALLVALIVRPFVSPWLAKAMAPLAGIAISAVVVASLSSLIVLHPVDQLIHMPSLRIAWFRTNASTTMIKIVTDAEIRSAKCWVGGYEARARIVGVSGGVLLIARVPLGHAITVVQRDSYVRVRCVVSMMFRGEPFEYRMFVAENVPIVLSFEVKRIGDELTLKPIKTPFSIPITINVSVEGCSTVKRVDNALVAKTHPLRIPWRCRELTLVRIWSEVAGHRLLRVYVVRG